MPTLTTPATPTSTPGESTRRVWASQLDQLNAKATSHNWWLETEDGRFLSPQAPAWFHDQYALFTSVGYANGWI